MKIHPGLKVIFKPSEEDFKGACNFGKEFGKRVLVKMGRLSPEELAVVNEP